MPTIEIGKMKAYASIYGGYTKKKAKVSLVDGDDKEVIGECKMEPIINGAGELVTWVCYYKGSGLPKETPTFFETPRALKKFLQVHHKGVQSPDDAYKKAANYKPLITGLVGELAAALGQEAPVPAEDKSEAAEALLGSLGKATDDDTLTNGDT